MLLQSIIRTLKINKAIMMFRYSNLMSIHTYISVDISVYPPSVCVYYTHIHTEYFVSVYSQRHIPSSSLLMDTTVTSNKSKVYLCLIH